MAEYQHTPAPVETTDRGLFDLGKNKDEEKMISSDFQEKVTVSECKTAEEKHHLNLHSSSTSSSSDDEEEGGDVEKKKKRKEKKSSKHEDHDTEVPIEKIHVEEEKVPGQHASDDLASPPPTPVVEVEEEKKKGILDKIKDKIPGFHSKPTSDDSN